MNRLTALLRGKRGSQLAEASIALPVVILASMLMIRMFVFCLEVLTSGIDEHKEAMQAQDAYKGVLIRTYESEKNVKLVRGGLLSNDMGREIKVKAYLINEDILVRSGEALEK